MALDSNSTLAECLAEALPEACRFNVHHLSTPPTPCPAIFAAPPGEQRDDTYCESHFLSVSINHDGNQLQVFAIEVLIYTTQYLTTLFVSKADSTGYLYLLNLPQGTPSPLRIISTTFLQFLIERRKRLDRRLVLSLFARAQNQYLFPGSVENSHKHVLDDRGLIKWWCRVVDPLLGPYNVSNDVPVQEEKTTVKDSHETKSAGYLRVPGCDIHETRNFLPNLQLRSTPRYPWATSDPLRQIGKSATLPERCLIPRFPDDPKARFVETLDDEIPDEIFNEKCDDGSVPNSLCMLESASKAEIITKNEGHWRSVKSLEQFWEMMQFRQECSSGRLVGFLWATFQFASLNGETPADTVAGCSPIPLGGMLPSPAVSQQRETTYFPAGPPSSPGPPQNLPAKTPPASPANPSPAATPIKAKEAAIEDQPEETKDYYWPKSSRGEIVLRQKDYKRVGDRLLRLDFADKDVAADSSKRWINDVTEKAGTRHWGFLVRGTRPAEVKAATNGHVNPTMLSTGLLKRKKRSAESPHGPGMDVVHGNNRSGINTLPEGLVRKKMKIAGHSEPVTNGDAQRIGKVGLG